MRHRIPYEVVGGVGFYERREVKDLLSYLRVVLNPRDPIALRRVINVPARGIGDKTVEEVMRVSVARGISPWEALAVVEEEALLPRRATQPLPAPPRPAPAGRSGRDARGHRAGRAGPPRNSRRW